jgi:hypothetical protein
MTKSISSIIILIFTLTLSSCKKDKLTGEKDILIGKWRWVYSEHLYNACNGPIMIEILTPLTENKNASIEFFKKGKVKFDDNKSKRIVFFSWRDAGQNAPNSDFKFGIRLNNDIESSTGGWVSSDTLILTGDYVEEPFEDVSCDGCCTYLNYYVKK